MFITLNALKLNGQDLTNTPKEISIEASALKYVFQHVKTSAYDDGNTEVIYYDEQASTLAILICEETSYDIFNTITSDEAYDASNPQLATIERINATKVTKPVLLFGNAYGYSVALSSKDLDSIAVVKHGSETVSTFQGGEVVTGQTTLATALVLYDSGFNTMYVHPLRGVLSGTEVIIGNTTGATATITSYTASNQKFLQYQEGEHSSVVKKDLVVLLSDNTASRAIQSASAANKTFTLSGNVHDDYSLDVPFFVDNSADNDGLYSVVSSRYNGSNTVITVRQSVPADSGVSGNIITI